MKLSSHLAEAAVGISFKVCRIVVVCPQAVLRIHGLVCSRSRALAVCMCLSPSGESACIKIVGLHAFFEWLALGSLGFAACLALQVHTESRRSYTSS